MELLEPLKLVSQGGAAVAVIVVVWLFLKQQDKFAILIKDIGDQSFTLVTAVSDKFTNALETHREKVDERCQQLATQQQEATFKVQDQVNQLVRDQIVANTNMTSAIRDLSYAVSDLQKKG